MVTTSDTLSMRARGGGDGERALLPLNSDSNDSSVGRGSIQDARGVLGVRHGRRSLAERQHPKVDEHPPSDSAAPATSNL